MLVPIGRTSFEKTKLYVKISKQTVKVQNLSYKLIIPEVLGRLQHVENTIGHAQVKCGMAEDSSQKRT